MKDVYDLTDVATKPYKFTDYKVAEMKDDQIKRHVTSN